VYLGFPTRHTGGSKAAPVPTTVPEVYISLPSPAVVEFEIRDADSNSRAKPPGVHCFVILSAVLPYPTTNWDDLIHTISDTKTPYRMVFKGEDRGKTVYFAVQWENTTGKRGPLSEIQSAIIP
jgi:hypothetical protein